MFFRNAILFRFPVSISQAILNGIKSDALDDARLKPIGQLDSEVHGLVSPFGLGDDRLYLKQDNFIHIVVGGETKVMPPPAINAEVAKRMKAIELEKGTVPGYKARRVIREDVIHEMLSRALVKPYRVNAYIDLERGFIAVDTISTKAAERVVSELRHALGSLPAIPLNAEVSPREMMTFWLKDTKQIPKPFRLNDSAELREASAHGAVAKLSAQELESDETRCHIESGKHCVSLGLVFDENLTLVFDEQLRVKRLKFLESVMEPLDNLDSDDRDAELSTRLFIMGKQIGSLFDALVPAFKLSKAEG